MRQIKPLSVFFWAFTFLAGFVLSSCGGGGSGGGARGTLSLSLTDAATADYKAVYVTIKEVKVVPATEDGEEAAEWIVVATPEKTYNLLELVNGVIEHLGDTTIEAGEYDQMRLVLGNTPDDGLNILGESHPFANYFIDANDNVQALTVPGGAEQGVKIVGGFSIESGQTTDLVLDFDVAKSIIQRGGSGDWGLQPTIRLIDEDNAAYVIGIVTDSATGDPLEGVLISAQAAGDGTSMDIVAGSTISDEAGEYQLMVDPGGYTLVAGMSGYKSGVANVTVIAGDDVTQDFSLEPGSGEGTITGIVTIEYGEEDQYVTVMARQMVVENSEETVVEVATASVADGGVYEFNLPEGVYAIVAVFDDDGVEMTMESGYTFILLDGQVIQFDIVFTNVDDPDQEEPGEKVDVCHNGHTINVSVSALQAHLNHGDTEGRCEGEENVDGP